MRAVLDANVLISALLSAKGTNAQLLREWSDGGFELSASPLLLAEVSRALTSYPKLSQRVSAGQAARFVALLRDNSTFVDDPEEAAPFSSADPGDDYVVALAFATGSPIVSGDRHLLIMEGQLPVFSPSAFVSLLGRERQ